MVQPVFSLVNGAPEFFSARKTPTVAIIAFALALTLGLPLVILLAEWVAEKSRAGWGRRLHDGARGVLVATVALGLLNWLDEKLTRISGIGSPGWLLLTLAAALGYRGIVLLRRSPVWRSFVRYLAVAAPAALGLFLVSAPMGSPAATRPAEATRPAPIVMLVLDELPTTSLLGAKGRIDAKRVPNFARLARDGTFYPNTTTIADQTTAAVPAILSGQRGPRHIRAPDLDDWPQNLFTLLHRQYRMEAREPITHLCSPDACPDEVRPARDAVSSLASEASHLALLSVAPSDLVPRSPLIGGAGERDPGHDISEFLSKIRPARRPTLNFAHVMTPHRPWGRLPSGRSYPVAGDGGVPASVRETLRLPADRRVALALWRAHLLQVGYADKLLGRVIDHLERTGMYDRSLVVVMADHGVSFRPGGPLRDATPDTVRNIAPVPLFVKQPGGRDRGIDPAAAQTIDVLPTILDVIGARKPAGIDGHSLLGPLPRDRKPSVLSTRSAYVKTTLPDLLRHRARTLRLQRDAVIDSPSWRARCRLPGSGC